MKEEGGAPESEDHPRFMGYDLWRMKMPWFRAYPFPMRYILVLHTGHVPRVAGLPFFMVTWLGFLISRIARHLRQYACIRFTSSLACVLPGKDQPLASCLQRRPGRR